MSELRDRYREAIEADWITLYPDPIERMLVRAIVESPEEEAILLYGDGRPRGSAVGSAVPLIAANER